MTSIKEYNSHIFLHVYVDNGQLINAIGNFVYTYDIKVLAYLIIIRNAYMNTRHNYININCFPYNLAYLKSINNNNLINRSRS